MRRILIDLPEAQVEALAMLVEMDHRPRAAVIRDAIEAYISQHRKELGNDVFGLWRGKRSIALNTKATFAPGGKLVTTPCCTAAVQAPRI